MYCAQGISLLSTENLDESTKQLAALLHSCVHDGASIGFILPFGLEEAMSYWEETVYPSVQKGERFLFVVRRSGRIVGTVQLGTGLPANQQHRADIAKLLVAPSERRRGLARALMEVAEQHARSLGKHLLVLDTRTGDPSQALYQSLGFEVAGEIPGYCRNPRKPVFEATTYLYKPLD